MANSTGQAALDTSADVVGFVTNPAISILRSSLNDTPSESYAQLVKIRKNEVGLPGLVPPTSLMAFRHASYQAVPRKKSAKRMLKKVWTNTSCH